MHVIAKVSTALIAVLLIPAVLLMACAAPAPQHKERAIIYGSFFPIYSLVSEIAGPDADVRSFMPYNQDPHLWEPSPKDIRALAEADLLVVSVAFCLEDGPLDLVTLVFLLKALVEGVLDWG
ncbi:metal ABC transporter substrate-binding protein, partial [Corynebacterium belfantii]|uniref:metal ABC transporter substrate-binding protein n=1 Tax=Corynebacterium belfantii TaxID=2014537 RepID=UPI0018D3D4E3